MDTPTTIKLMLAISFTLYREVIHRIIEEERDIEIIAETSTELEIIPTLAQNRPDVLFIDSSMYKSNQGILETLGAMRKRGIDTKVLVLLHTMDEEFIIKAISLGIRGYLSPAANAEEFVRAIRTITKGEIWAERRIMTKVLTRAISLRGFEPTPTTRFTKREKEVIKLVSEGCTNKQVAKRLLVSESTVKFYLRRIFKKLGIVSRRDLAINFGKGLF
jgi:DNA-binding NarL/FixJ family response regulator